MFRIVTAPTPLAPDRDPAVVLVVDAHEPSRLGLGVGLQREAWVERCVVAASVEHGALLARRWRVDAAVLDASDLGPFAAGSIEKLREARPHLPVVLTAHCASVVVPNPSLIGAAAFFSAGSGVAAIARGVESALTDESVVEPRATVDHPTGTVLSPRERDVLALLITGATNREIARELFLGQDTVKKHASSLYRKLGVRNRTEATQLAINGLARR